MLDNSELLKLHTNQRLLVMEMQSRGINVDVIYNEIELIKAEYGKSWVSNGGKETNIVEYNLSYDLEQQRKESKEFLDDLTTRDQRMMFANLTLVITADTKEKLDADTETILITGRKHLCQIAPLTYQQMDGLNTALPIGVRNVKILRTLTTESLSALMPFRVQEIMDKGGIYYGENAISHNLIMVNKENLQNQSSFLLGVPGSGKSFSAKELIVFLALSTDDDIMICDPEGEYGNLVRQFKGEVIKVSSKSKDYLNPLDINSNYGDGDAPLKDKANFIMSMLELVVGGSGLTAEEKSVIDRCLPKIYEKYFE